MGKIIYNSTGLPAQITYGFVGLIPIADGFAYRVDPKLHQVHGYIEGRSSIAGLGHMVIGTITKLVSVELFRENGKATNCSLNTVSSTDPSRAAWEFTCMLIDVSPAGFYDQRIKITFGTDSGQQASTEGRLQGKIVEPGTVLYLPVQEIEQILVANAAAADLLSDHILIRAGYNAEIDPSYPNLGLKWGEAILLGEVRWDSGTVRYTIGTPFVLQDGKVIYWSLTRAALQKMIAQIADLPLTRRLYHTLPGLTLNLWYAEKGDLPKTPYMSDAHLEYNATITACGAIPARTLPQDEPLRAFGFGSRWSLWQADFVFVKDTPVVYELALWPGRDDREGAMRLLVPKQLDWKDAKPFSSIRMDRFGREPRLSLNVEENMDPADIQTLRSLVKALPGKADFQYSTVWSVSGVSIAIDKDGLLMVVSCSTQ
ncbi:MAG TPA: hypothetical protein VHV83_15465 [Armatimonadota bacterium]|nr:hypothetical protein [Armatimonadota bacterium]